MTERRATVVGIGMIGGSIAAALKAHGWHVSGWDVDAERLQAAHDAGVIDTTEPATDSDITFIATPVSAIIKAAREALARNTSGIVTDAGSVKRSIVQAIDDPRFVAGHPMAGSERSGLEGIDATLFEGATWVLTPGPSTTTDAYATVRTVVNELGADVVTLDARQHDEMVATISHVPHLTASALMTLALARSADHDAVLRLAAGGFRDMTRIAAGHPDLWADIALENHEAITQELRKLAASVSHIGDLVEAHDRAGLRAMLDSASRARNELPLRSGRPAELAVVRVPIPDEAGALGNVLGIFGELRVNVEDLDIAHDPKGDRGTLQVTIAQTGVQTVRKALDARGYRNSVENL